MTLHTTSDGQITYEGLPVVNQEEVKKWLWELDYNSPTSYLDWVHYVLPKKNGFELPDDEFEAKEAGDLIPDPNDHNCLKYKEFVTILRKPVSEEGEKNFVDQPADIQEALSKGGYWEMLGEGEKKDKRLIMDDLIYEHLHRFGENNLFRASLDSFRETGKASGSFRAALHAMLEEYRSEGQGEKNKGLGGSSDLENVIDSLCEKHLPSAFELESFKPDTVEHLKSAFRQGANVMKNYLTNNYENTKV